MATDIVGWIEVLPAWALSDGEGGPPRWSGGVKVDALLNTDNDAFGCLFGVRNLARFRPLAASRGLLAGLSPEAERDAREWAADGALVGPTWVGWPELRDLDWEERAAGPDSRLHQYARAADGSLRYDGKASWDPRIFHLLGVTITQALTDPPEFAEGQEWELNGVVFRAETLRRKDALGPRWRRLFRLMALLAEDFGDEGVRLVVWFDQ